MWWSIPAAIRSPLARVRWASRADARGDMKSSASSGAASAAAARGSFDIGGIGSLATSSDWTTIRVGPSSGSTS